MTSLRYNTIVFGEIKTIAHFSAIKVMHFAHHHFLIEVIISERNQEVWRDKAVLVFDDFRYHPKNAVTNKPLTLLALAVVSKD